MLKEIDRSQKLLCFLLGLTVLCFCVMVSSKIPFVLAGRSGRPQFISLSWVFPLAFIGLTVPFLLRNLGGLASIFAAGLIAGGTMFSTLFANVHNEKIAISWAQFSLSVILVVAAVVAISRMNIDWSNVGVDDLLN